MIVIVCRYYENVDWATQLPNVLVCNKGEKLDEAKFNQVFYKNVGREGNTIYKYICDNYDNLENYTIFLQGNPFDHSPNVIQKIHNYFDNEENLNIDFEYISEWIITCNITGCRHHPGLNLKVVYQKIFNDFADSREFVFGAGAQFIVSREQIRKRPREFYMNIVEILGKEVNPIEGYSVERFHKMIFS
jgi:hypothetical protein